MPGATPPVSGPPEQGPRGPIQSGIPTGAPDGRVPQPPALPEATDSARRRAAATVPVRRQLGLDQAAQPIGYLHAPDREIVDDGTTDSLVNPEVAQRRKFYRAVGERTQEAKERELERVAAGLKAWPTYSSSLAHYQAVFADVLDDQPLEEWVQERREQTGRVFVLNAMGPLGVFSSDKVDGEVAITLNNFSLG